MIETVILLSGRGRDFLQVNHGRIQINDCSKCRSQQPERTEEKRSSRYPLEYLTYVVLQNVAQRLHILSSSFDLRFERAKLRRPFSQIHLIVNALEVFTQLLELRIKTRILFQCTPCSSNRFQISFCFLQVLSKLEVVDITTLDAEKFRHFLTASTNQRLQPLICRNLLPISHISAILCRCLPEQSHILHEIFCGGHHLAKLRLQISNGRRDTLHCDIVISRFVSQLHLGINQLGTIQKTALFKSRRLLRILNNISIGNQLCLQSRPLIIQHRQLTLQSQQLVFVVAGIQLCHRRLNRGNLLVQRDQLSIDLVRTTQPLLEDSHIIVQLVKTVEESYQLIFGADALQSFLQSVDLTLKRVGQCSGRFQSFLQGFQPGKLICLDRTDVLCSQLGCYILGVLVLFDQTLQAGNLSFQIRALNIIQPPFGGNHGLNPGIDCGVSIIQRCQMSAIRNRLYRSLTDISGLNISQKSLLAIQV